MTPRTPTERTPRQEPAVEAIIVDALEVDALEVDALEVDALEVDALENESGPLEIAEFVEVERRETRDESRAEPVLFQEDSGETASRSPALKKTSGFSTFATIWETDDLRPVEITKFERDAAPVTEFVDSEGAENVEPCPHPFRHPLRAAAWIVRTAFGLVSLFFLLAIVAAIPFANILALGYLLDVEGRLGRRGRLRDAFPLLDHAPRIGSIALGLWLWLFPLRLLADAAADARLIDPDGAAARNLGRLTIAAAVLIGLHLCLALARGGGFWCFFRPLKNVLWLLGVSRRESDRAKRQAEFLAFITGLRLPQLFSLGFRGLVGAFAWLVVPTALFAVAGRDEGITALVTMYGGYLLLLVFAVLPFLQARFAAENRFGAMFELADVLRLYTRAPITWTIAILFVYALALPLYLLKVVLPPQDAMWLITIVFIASIYPVKVIVGWSYHRAVRTMRRDQQTPRTRWWYARRLLMPMLCAVPIAAVNVTYVFLLYFTQYIGEHGKWVLFEHHAFLLPGATLGPLTVVVCVGLVLARFAVDWFRRDPQGSAPLRGLRVAANR